jgi:hypothetical protein
MCMLQVLTKMRHLHKVRASAAEVRGSHHPRGAHSSALRSTPPSDVTAPCATHPSCHVYGGPCTANPLAMPVTGGTDCGCLMTYGGCL